MIGLNIKKKSNLGKEAVVGIRRSDNSCQNILCIKSIHQNITRVTTVHFIKEVGVEALNSQHLGERLRWEGGQQV